MTTLIINANHRELAPEELETVAGGVEVQIESIGTQVSTVGGSGIDWGQVARAVISHLK